MNSDVSRATYRWLVSGRVQGVAFRWFVLSAARQLGVLGWVRNLPDGRVDVVGQGNPEVLSILDGKLRDGPRLSHVQNVEKTDITHEVDGFNSFEIK
ncbi:MAG: acylphosphatase [Gemmatimonadetes bacterium]|nr:acylphosphatase [Gemmatimonadota bacterium]